MIDLLIVGAGPVGLVTAIHAVNAGLQVTVIEPRVGTIDKACGEGLMPDALNHLASIGINPPGVDFHGIRYVSGDRMAEARFTNGPGRGVRRTTLHECLWKRAVELNVDFVEGRVDVVAQNETHVEAAGIKARYLIGADGLHSEVRNQLDLGVANRKPTRQRYGVRQHFYVSPWTDLVEVYWLDNAEVYVTPVDQGAVGIAVLGSNKINFEETISRIPMLQQHMKSAEPASKLRGAGPLRQDVRARSKGRTLLVGDAAGYIDALTGEGMRVGFSEGKAAVAAVLANDPHSYEAEWQKITRSYRLLAGGLLWASSHQSIRSMIVPAAQTFRPIFSRLVNSLG